MRRRPLAIAAATFAIVGVSVLVTRGPEGQDTSVTATTGPATTLPSTTTLPGDAHSSGDGLTATTQEPSTTTGSTVPSATKKPSTTTQPKSSKPSTTKAPATTAPATVVQAELPTELPVTIEGATVTRYMPTNEIQASLYGIKPEDMHTWLMDFAPTADPKADHKRLRNGLSAAGMTVKSDDLQYFLSSGDGIIAGTWKEFRFVLSMLDWKSITFAVYRLKG